MNEDILNDRTMVLISYYDCHILNWNRKELLHANEGKKEEPNNVAHVDAANQDTALAYAWIVPEETFCRFV